jgi:hypothetical protein
MPGRWLAARCSSALARRPVRLRAAPLWPARLPAPLTANQKLWQGPWAELPRQSIGVGCRRAVAGRLAAGPAGGGQRARDESILDCGGRRVDESMW